MSSDTTGANETLATEMINQLVSGGITIHLLTSAVNYSDGATALSSASSASADVAEADLTVTTPSDWSGETTITVDVDVEFGAQDIGIVEEHAIQSQSNTDRFILSDETNDPELTGEDYTLEAGHVIYNFGNPQ